jgi:transposase InsO family protein
MGLTMSQRQAVTKQMALKYKRATKKQKGEILDTLTELTGYNRSYAARVLRQRARYVVVGRGVVKGVNVRLVEDERAKRRKKRRNRPSRYGKDVLVALQKVWVICDGICGKRLAAYLEEIVPVLERLGELTLDVQTKRKLIGISPATIDRMLAPTRRRYQLRARSQTKPGTLLKHQVPIRTFSEWDDMQPGFVEVDLVSHEGGNARGEYAYTLDATDVCTAWTETEAVRNRSQMHVFDGLEKALSRFPFAIRGIHSDNGSEFINNHLVRYCAEREITFTRSRPYRKNDNCFVEQKNYSVVRRAVGYRRYDTPEELETLNGLYGPLRLFTNYFQPSMKLIDKTRTGSKVRKKYDQAKTPYQRVLDSRTLSSEAEAELKAHYMTLNPVKLGREISRLQDCIDALAKAKREAQEAFNLEYIST